MEMTGEQVFTIIYDELSDKKYDNNNVGEKLLNDNDFYLELCGEVNRFDNEKQVIKKLKQLINKRSV